MGDFQNEELQKQQMLLKQFLEQDKTGQIRSAVNMSKEKEGYDTFQYNKSVTKNDADLLAELLSSTTIEITDEERARLEAMQARNLAHLLVNEEKTTGDSKEMTRVKEAVISVEQFLNAERKDEMKSSTLAVAGVDRLLVLYDDAIKACQDYCDNKNPTFAKGKERKRQVQANLDRLVEESAEMVRARELLRDGTLDGKVTNYRSLLVQAKVAAFAKIQAHGEEAEPQVRGKYRQDAEFSDADVKKAGPEVYLMYQMMAGKMRASDLVESLKKNKKTKELGEKLPAVFAEFRKIINGFKEGIVGVGTVQVGSVHMTVVQDSKNRIRLRAEGMEIPMERNSRLMLDVLDEDMITHEEVYGKEQAQAVAGQYIEDYKGMVTGGEEARVRFMLTKYLAAKTGQNAAAFNDVSLDNLISAFRYVQHGNELKGKTLDGLLGAEAFDTINGQETQRLIKHEKIREQLEEAGLQQEKKVIYEQKPEEAPQAEENAVEWTEEEKKVKDLIADLVYSQDTWETDALKSTPGERVRQVLIRNAEAIVYLVSDIYQKDESKKQVLINGILDKMPLFMLGDDKVKEMKTKLAEQIGTIVGTIDQVLSAVVDKNLGPDANAFTKMMALATAKGKVMLAKDNLDEVVEMIQGQLEDIHLDGAGGGDEEDEGTQKLRKILSESETSIDGMVGSVSNQMQDMVSSIAEKLFNPKEQKAEEPMPEGELEKIEWGEKKLGKMVVEALKGGDHGAGAFNRQIFMNYFSCVSAMDQRSMIASALRSAKPVKKFQNPDEANISPAEKEKRETARDDAVREAMGNYLGGMLKGAGPLFQKIMQGLPAEGMPAELQEAIKDMKSRLAPIPEKVVKAQLASMVERSGGKVTKIEVTQPLGSASVGQTFLCKMYGPDLPENGEEVVVKLLKPDVRNRMEREKEVLLQCAKNVDDGTYQTYKGQLERIEEELDLTIEARNLEKGRIYNKPLDAGEESDEVTSMELHTLVAPTINSMVLKKAEGMPIDRYMDSVEEEQRRLLEPLYIRERDSGEILLEKDPDPLTGEKLPMLQEIPIIDEFGPEGELEKASPVYVIEQMTKKLIDLQKRKSYVMKFAQKWTTEGIFDEGFYHGDPHEGNIMVSEDKLTVIDYGNATKLTKDQQEQITRMMCAAAVGDMETFRSGFHALLNPKFEELYQANREALGREFKKIFKLGDKSSAGQRIMVCLLKAQEMGLEVPSAVYNLSQGQMRLQNTIAHMNQSITMMQSIILKLQDRSFDVLEHPSLMKHSFENSSQKVSSKRNLKDFSTIYSDMAKDLLIFTNSKEDVCTYLDDWNESYDASFEKEVLTRISEPSEFSIDISSQIDGQREAFGLMFEAYKESMAEAETLENEEEKQQRRDKAESTYQKAVKSFCKAGKNTYYGIYRPFFDENIWDDVREAFKTKNPDTVAKVLAAYKTASDKAAAQEKLLAAEQKNYRDMKEAYKAFLKEKRRLKGKYETRDNVPREELDNLNTLRDHFLDLYMPFHADDLTTNEYYFDAVNSLVDPKVANEEPETIREAEMKMRSYLASFVAPGAYRADEMKEAMDLYWEARRTGGRYEAASDKLREVWYDISVKRMREHTARLREIDSKKQEDFIDVMGEVIEKKTSEAVSRIGFFKSFSYSSNLESQGKRRKKLEKARENAQGGQNNGAGDDDDD